MTSRFLIYGLVDPRTYEVRYIGKSTCGLSRPREHGKPSKLAYVTHKSSWIRALRSAGFDYSVRVLEEVDPEDADALGLLERFWIAQARESGWRLTNLTDGGEGTTGHTVSAEARERIAASKRGTKQSQELVEKRIAPLRGRRRSASSVAGLLAHNAKVRKSVIELNSGCRFESVTAAARAFGLLASHVSLVLRGGCKHAKGFRFAYAGDEATNQ